VKRKPIKRRAKTAAGSQVNLSLVRRHAIHRADTFRAIGEFMFEFSQLEFTIRAALAARLELSDDYFNIVVGPYDFRMLCTVTYKASCVKYPGKKGELEVLYNECHALNDRRNHIAHGLWTDGVGSAFSVRVLSRNSLQTTFHLYSKDELHRLSSKAQELMQRVMGFSPASRDHPKKA
jgi:hypothetical protein